MTEQFMAACLSGDLTRMMELLAPDVVVWSDGGGRVSAALRPVRGADNAARGVLGALRWLTDVGVSFTLVNGRPGVLITSGGVIDNVACLDVVDGRIIAIRWQTGRVSFLGVRPGRRDPELAGAARRRERAFARDIGDEKSLARDPDEVPRRSSRLGWIALALIVLAAVGGVPLFRSQTGLLAANCQQAALALSRPVAGAGTDLAWQAAGPRDGQYAVVLDGAEVTADPSGRLSAPGGQLLVGPFGMDSCRSSQAIFTTPRVAGSHLLTLLHRGGTAGYQKVASAALRLT